MAGMYSTGLYPYYFEYRISQFVTMYWGSYDLSLGAISRGIDSTQPQVPLQSGS